MLIIFTVLVDRTLSVSGDKKVLCDESGFLSMTKYNHAMIVMLQNNQPTLGLFIFQLCGIISFWPKIIKKASA
ncbi:hypothetical protein [Izhakiella capsodis]|uniref:hypothetical protein n=1 Tax=Izhakiella capsodis TaxID=1367852 RepID=UPI000B877AA6|nr:hypothetical protein [Izhakiella capsodis]